MASLFKSLFGRGEIEVLPEELRKLIERAQREKKALGALVKKAASASQSMQEIAGPLEETRTTVKDISGQLADLKDDAAIGAVFSLIESLEERAKDLAQSHDQATSTLAATLQGAADLEERLTGLGQVVSEVSDARDDIAKLSGPAGMVAKLKEQTEETRTTIKDIGGQLADLKDNTAIAEVFSRMESLEERAEDLAQSHDQATSSLAATLQGANDLEQRLTGLGQVVSEVSDARDDIAKLSGPAGMVAKLKEQIVGLEDQIREVEKRGDGLRNVTSSIEVAEAQAKEVTAEQVELAKALEESHRGVEELAAKFADLEGGLPGMRSDIEGLAAAHQEAAELLGPSGMMAKLRDQSEKLRLQLAEYGGQIVRVREDQSDIRSSQERALSKYDEVRSHMDVLNE